MSRGFTLILQCPADLSEKLTDFCSSFYILLKVLKFCFGIVCATSKAAQETAFFDSGVSLMVILKKVVSGLGMIGAASVLLFSMSAHAGLIFDVDNPYVFLKQGESHSVTHDLTEYGVSDGYAVTKAGLYLGFSDGFFFGDLAWDIAQVSGDGISAIFEVDGTHIFGFDFKWLDVGSDGIDSLNATGLLEVTVTALNTPRHKGFNDFWWKTSKLVAKVEPVSVPEPGTLTMLGMGLLGLGISRRLRKA